MRTQEETVKALRQALKTQVELTKFYKIKYSSAIQVCQNLERYFHKCEYELKVALNRQDLLDANAKLKAEFAKFADLIKDETEER